MELRRQCGLVNINKLMEVPKPDFEEEEVEDEEVSSVSSSKIENLCWCPAVIPEEVTICAGILDDIIDSVVHEASSIVPAPVPSPVKRRRATLRHQLSQDLSGGARHGLGRGRQARRGHHRARLLR